MQELDYQDFLKNMGIEKGDIIDVASDLMSIWKYCRKEGVAFEPNHLLDSLQDMVGENGTIMIRAFSWDFCKGENFDIQNSPSRVGALGNIALKRKDFKRTQHPIYSWLVWGKSQNELCSMENINSFGDDTPFDFLYSHQGKLLCIGNMVADGLTHIHQAEKWANVRYRKEKEFKGVYIGNDRSEEYKTYSMFVRPLNYEVKMLSPEGYYSDWKKQNIMLSQMYNGALSCECFDIRRIVNYALKDFKENEGKKMVSINGQIGMEDFTEWELLDFGIDKK